MLRFSICRPCILWALMLAGFVVWIGTGCIAGVHHHRIDTTQTHGTNQVDVEGTVSSVDFGLVADFRYARLAFPFEGHRRQVEVDIHNGSGFTIDEVVELRMLRVDVPLWSIVDLDGDSSRWYPGRMPRRHSLELWVSGSVGLTPIHPTTATVGFAYYKYGAVAVRAYGGVSTTPYSGLERRIENGGEVNRRLSSQAPGMVAGLEVTLAAGEYALELFKYFLERDRAGRGVTDRWN